MVLSSSAFLHWFLAGPRLKSINWLALKQTVSFASMDTREGLMSPTDNTASPTVFNTGKSPRLGIDGQLRLPLSAVAAFMAGVVLGASHGSSNAAFRFRAENAHRFPTNPSGWYQYHKTKNYHSMVGAGKESVRLGAKLGFGAFTFCLFEETVDLARNGQRDFGSTIIAGLSFSGAYSLLGMLTAIGGRLLTMADVETITARHDIYTAARTARLGLKYSVAYGLLQDVLATAKGNRPRYVESIVNSFKRFSE